MYQHDVFISYKREPLWTPWTRDHFKKLLKAYLEQDLGYEPSIFIDERISIGADWVDTLAEHLAASKVLVAVFSANYFGSDWCLHELDLMLARSVAHLAGGAGLGLIIPVVVHDGDLIPVEVRRIQPADFSDFHVACMVEGTPRYENFSVAMRTLTPFVRDAIQSAPDYDPVWKQSSRVRFNQVYQAQQIRQNVDPTGLGLRHEYPWNHRHVLFLEGRSRPHNGAR
jgi:hypothetical protein